MHQPVRRRAEQEVSLPGAQAETATMPHPRPTESRGDPRPPGPSRSGPLAVAVASFPTAPPSSGSSAPSSPNSTTSGPKVAATSASTSSPGLGSPPSPQPRAARRRPRAACRRSAPDPVKGPRVSRKHHASGLDQRLSLAPQGVRPAEAVPRATPLADVLRARAVDVRELPCSLSGCRSDLPPERHS